MELSNLRAEPVSHLRLAAQLPCPRLMQHEVLLQTDRSTGATDFPSRTIRLLLAVVAGVISLLCILMQRQPIKHRE